MKYKLKDICLTVTDGSHFSPKAQDEGFPMFSVKDMLEYGFDYSNCKRISEEDFEKMRSSGCVPQEGDVLVAKDGSYLKEIFVCTETKDEAILSSIAIFRPNQEMVNPYYLCYLLKSPQIFNYISSNCVSGSALPRIVLKAFKEVEMDVPSMDIQLKVVNMLKFIDAKVQTNTAINRNLEQQALAIFDDMFSDVSAGNKLIGDIITPKRGKGLLSKDAVFGDAPVVAGGLEPATYHNIANTTSPVLTISASGANAGFVNLWNIPVWSSDSSFIDADMTNDVYFWYVMLKKRQQEIFDAQTGSAQPHIYPKHIAAMPIVELEQEDITQFTSIVTPMFQTIGENKKQNTKLAELRDSLLPRLMSGKLDVSNIAI